MSATLLIKNALTVRGDGSEPETGSVLVDTEAGTISACGKSAGDGTFVYDAGGAPSSISDTSTRVTAEACSLPRTITAGCLTESVQPSVPEKQSGSTAIFQR